ncbi:MAG TPA: hypothetical protein VHX88_17860 [Solirubrobacteraceae bacterium]|jgi:hypothetical protein|nr:hypothetical protein [Solirubrobacteraceae bacterium]
MGHGLPSASQIQKRVQQGVGPLGRLGALGIGGPPVHAQLVVPNGSGGFQAITVDSGTVGSVSASTLTVDEAYDGHTYQDVPITIPSGAVVQRDGSTVSLSNLRSGDEVTVARSSSTTRVFAWHAQQAPGPFGEHWPGVPGSMHFFGMP